MVRLPSMAVTLAALLALLLLLFLDGAEAFAGATKQPSSPTTFVPRSGSASTGDGGNTLTLFSPCKINLFLRIIRKREDGYHDLASLFQAIGFGDTLELTPIIDDDDDESSHPSADDDDVFTCNMPGVPTDSTNLVLRALRLMREKTGSKMRFHASLHKNCPAQAGLGGGSANAATALWGANQLMGRPASLEQVTQMRCVCGAHVYGDAVASGSCYLALTPMSSWFFFFFSSSRPIILSWWNGRATWAATSPFS